MDYINAKSAGTVNLSAFEVLENPVIE